VKRRVITTYEKDGITLRELDGIEKVEGAPIIEAFPVVGVTGLLSVQYIIDQLDLPLVGVVAQPDGLPTSVVMKSQPGPSIRIYGNEKLVAWVSETKPSEKVARGVVQLIIEFAHRHHSSMIYCVEGVPTQDNVVNRQKLSFLTTNEKIGHRMKELGHEYVFEAVITGVTGGIVVESPFIEMDTTCLLCPSSAYFPDASSALELVKILIQLVPSLKEVDTTPLENKASFIENKVKKLMKLSTSGGGGPPAGMFG